MKNLSLFICIALISLTGCSDSEPESTLTVEGSATVKVPVDYLKFRVSLQKQSAVLEPLVEESYQTMLQLKHILLEEWNIPDSLVQTDESSIRRYYNRNDTDVFYRFSQSMIVRLDSLELYETLRRDLLNAGANEFEITYFGTLNRQKYQEKVFKKAYANALEKATVLANAANLTIEEPQKVSTSRSINLDADFDLSMAIHSPQQPIPPNQILESTLIKEYKELQANVNVKFSLE